MSSGFSPSDIVPLVALTMKVYKGWKDACGDYADLTGTLQSLILLLNRVDEHFATTISAPQGGGRLEPAWQAAEKHDLEKLIRNCDATVKELHDVVKRYRSLGTNKRNNWDKFKYGITNFNVLRTRLAQHISLLNIFLDAVELQALNRIHDDVRALPETIMRRLPWAIEALYGRQADDARSSRGSIMTMYEDDDKLVWRAFRSNLVKSGIKSRKFDKYKSELLAYLANLDQRTETCEVDAATVSMIQTTMPVSYNDSIAFVDSPVEESQCETALRFRGINTSDIDEGCDK